MGRIELGAQNYSLACTFDGRPSVGLAVFQLPGTNALDVGNRIRAKMEELKANFPEGVACQIAYDTTPFIRESVANVERTLLEAAALVAVVVLVFLQNWRAALIPLVAVPVAIVGIFAAMAALGFSLNNVSLFGLVLAIGIVVENVERWLEQGKEPREAARLAMDEVTGPVIAVALVLCAVFVPCAFITGITGERRATHKPLVVLYALGRWQNGQKDVSFGRVEPELTALLREFGPPRRSDHPEQPFWRLQRDGVWTVHAPAGLETKKGADIPRVTELRSHDVRAEFSPDVQAALAADPALVAAISSRHP